MMNEIKYYEVEMASNERLSDTYSMCIKATHKPTTEEVEQFLKVDMSNCGYDFVSSIDEISLEEAKQFYDMEKEKDFPILD